ncbi:hypothetical protein HPB50_013052 [Hyalomma asiaticum]|uniref:Uncharacterized protein n=1 Tax=Hyalomma asiaticum TaxID=266040 RepID=A0ACB7SN93_HYAAI|nr:hypothetical protein HPB50_013052 [Hyalomma asiaticum]
MRGDFFVVLLCLGIFTLVVDVALEALPRYLHAMVRSDRRRRAPPVFAAELDGSIFFSGGWTQKCLDFAEACAVESAAHHHPGMWVVIFLDVPDRDGGDRVEGDGPESSNQCSTLEALLDIKNVHVRRINLDELFARTPLKYWRAQNPGERHPERLRDAVRFALLWKYGGVYADLDIIVKRPLTKLRNCVGERKPEDHGAPFVSRSLLVFDRRHPLMEMCMEEMARQYHDSRLLVHPVSEAIVQSLRDHYVCERHDSKEELASGSSCAAPTAAPGSLFGLSRRSSQHTIGRVRMRQSTPSGISSLADPRKATFWKQDDALSSRDPLRWKVKRDATALASIASQKMLHAYLEQLK